MPPKEAEEFVTSYGGNALQGGISVKNMIKRNIPLKDIIERFNLYGEYAYDILERVETNVKYEGYLKRTLEQIERQKKTEEKLLPKDIDYRLIGGLRLEAQEKLERIRPISLGQAERISGVNPADIAVLMVYLNGRR